MFIVVSWRLTFCDVAVREDEFGDSLECVLDCFGVGLKSDVIGKCARPLCRMLGTARGIKPFDSIHLTLVCVCVLVLSTLSAVLFLLFCFFI